MMRTRGFLFVVLAVSAGAAMLVACSDDDAPLASTDGADAADAQPQEASPKEDAGGDVDADAPVNVDGDASDEPVQCASTPCVTQITAGDEHFCALVSDGTVRCWGNDEKGELGSGAPEGGGLPTGFGPVKVVGLTNVTQLSAAGATSCARTTEGRVFCWGDNQNAQLGLQVGPGLTDSDPHPTPIDVGLPITVASVEVGPANVYALGVDSEVYGWGANYYMQLGTEDDGPTGPGPIDVHGYQLTRIAAGFGAVLGLTGDGQLVGWGQVTGRASTVDSAKAPFPLLSISGVTSFAIDGMQTPHACAISEGNVRCWGANTVGVLGTGVPDPQLLPTVAPLYANGKAFPQQVAAAANTTCVRMTDGSVQCCGDDTLGQLGRGETGTLTPSFVPATAFQLHAVQVATSRHATCALVRDGHVVCWGGNPKGELGQSNNDLDAHPSPVNVVIDSSK